MDIKSNIWYYHQSQWKSGKILSYLEDDMVDIKIENENCTQKVKTEDIKQQNNIDLQEINNLINLIHLHEPAILKTVRERYLVDKIYTYTGSILLAINPFHQLPIYTLEEMKKYYDISTSEMDILPPHIFQVANLAYQQLLRDNKDQSILVSGESGAGKTVSAKYIMQYLSQISEWRLERSVSERSGKSVLEKRILDSNPILESFGNAKTIRNDNSSRFGKFIQIYFDKRGKLTGSKIKTYLLEKIRVIHQNMGECNFHIFYQMLSAPPEKKTEWNITDDISYKFLTNQSNSSLRDGINDVKEYEDTLKAFQSLDFTPQIINDIYSLVAGILHLGNIQITGGDIAEVKLEDSHLQDSARLLQIPPELLVKCLTTKKIKAGREICQTNLNKEKAEYSRDSIAKSIYLQLYKYIVKQINHSFEKDCQQNPEDKFLGILDIFGFEIFEENSLEQLCINYTNETLQQLFNEFIFKLEQEEYQQEGIKWIPIDYPDNQGRVALIEGKNGIFTYLDEQCMMPRGNDSQLFSTLVKQLGENSFLNITSRLKVDNKFKLDHYAGEVTYGVDSFCDKNKNQNSAEIISLFETSKNIVLHQQLKPVSESEKRKIHAISVVSNFKQQLHLLVKTISATEINYIRCLKPNDVAKAYNFVNSRVLVQLRYSGVLEAIKIARAGFPIRFPYQKFIDRYKMILAKDSSQRIKKSLQELNIDVSNFAEGNSKLFLKKEAYNVLENQRIILLNQSALLIAKNWKKYYDRNKYLVILKSNLILQSFTRQVIAKNIKWKLRYQKRSIQIQSCWRRYQCYQKYQHKRQAIDKIIRWHRRIHYISTLRRYQEKEAIIKIQAWYNRIKRVRNAIIIQCNWKVYLAKKEKRKLYQEARDINKLHNKIKELEQQTKVVATKGEDEISEIVKGEILAHQKEMEENLMGKMEKMFQEWESERKETLYREWEENMLNKLSAENQEKYWSQNENQDVVNFLEREIGKEKNKNMRMDNEMREIKSDISDKNDLIQKISRQSAEQFSVSLSLTEKIGRLLMDNCELKEKLKYKRKKGWFS